MEIYFSLETKVPLWAKEEKLTWDTLQVHRNYCTTAPKDI